MHAPASHPPAGDVPASIVTATPVIAPLEAAHLDDVVAIERLSYTLPWSREMFASELRREGGLHLGAWVRQQLCGHLVVSRFAEVWHIMNVAVHPAMRGGGIATRLLDECFGRTASDAMRGYTLEVRVSNHAAINLYEGYGFESRGMRRGYYVDNGEDALVMWKPPPGAAPGWEPDL